MSVYTAARTQASAGRRDLRVTIEQLTPSTGSTGYPIETWTTLTTVWMGREDLLAGERFTANQETAFKDTRWEMEYLADMDPDVLDVPKVRRLNHEGRIYNIRSASMIGRRRAIELITLAKVG